MVQIGDNPQKADERIFFNQWYFGFMSKTTTKSVAQRAASWRQKQAGEETKWGWRNKLWSEKKKRTISLNLLYH